MSTQSKEIQPLSTTSSKSEKVQVEELSSAMPAELSIAPDSDSSNFSTVDLITGASHQYDPVRHIDRKIFEVRIRLLRMWTRFHGEYLALGDIQMADLVLEHMLQMQKELDEE